jgi:hypothetical protein
MINLFKLGLDQYYLIFDKTQIYRIDIFGQLDIFDLIEFATVEYFS